MDCKLYLNFLCVFNMFRSLICLLLVCESVTMMYDFFLFTRCSFNDAMYLVYEGKIKKKVLLFWVCDHIYPSNRLAQAVTLLSCIREVPGSNLYRDFDYHEVFLFS
jgi:hypothetical protein